MNKALKKYGKVKFARTKYFKNSIIKAFRVGLKVELLMFNHIDLYESDPEKYAEIKAALLEKYLK